MSVSASFALADTNVHKLSDLIKSPGPLEDTNNFPKNTFTGDLAADFTELRIIPDAANGGTIGVGINAADVDITGKEFGILLSSTSAPFVWTRAWGGSRLSAKDVCVVASGATQTFHVIASF